MVFKTKNVPVLDKQSFCLFLRFCHLTKITVYNKKCRYCYP